MSRLTGEHFLEIILRQLPTNIKINSDKVIAYLAKQWQDCGICPGDTVLLHSDLTRILLKLRRSFAGAGPDVVLASFLKALEPAGTLLLPSFSFSFSQSRHFDIRHTPSEMGALTEYARNQAWVLRTHHPLASFVVIGAAAQHFQRHYVSGWGQDSPLALLHQMKGKIAILDVTEKRSMTFYHYVEECYQVPYRFHKTFFGHYVDAQGQKSHCQAKLFVRRLEQGIVTNTSAMGEYLWQQGLYQGQRPRTGCGLRVIQAEDVFRVTSEVILSGCAEGMLYTVTHET